MRERVAREQTKRDREPGDWERSQTDADEMSR